MENEVVQLLFSADARNKIEVSRGSHGRFRYMQFAWRPYDEEFKRILKREGDWHMGQQSGLFETLEECIRDARLAVPWLDNSSSD